MNSIFHRVSIRRYQDQPVEKEKVELLMRAGMTLSRYHALDRTVERFIRSGNFNIYEINETLFEQDLPLLGAC